ncbi:hypothetical protein ACJJTC_011588 [Scirpophaga incertulas]
MNKKENKTYIPQYSGEMQACAYVCGFIAKNIENDCLVCGQMFIADQNTEVCHIFTSFKENDEEKSTLKYIQPSFCSFVENAATNINNHLKENSHKDNIKVNLRKKCELLNYDWDVKFIENQFSFQNSSTHEQILSFPYLEDTESITAENESSGIIPLDNVDCAGDPGTTVLSSNNRGTGSSTLIESTTDSSTEEEVHRRYPARQHHKPLSSRSRKKSANFNCETLEASCRENEFLFS